MHTTKIISRALVPALAATALAAPAAIARPIDASSDAADAAAAQRSMRERALAVERYYNGRDLTTPAPDQSHFRGADTTSPPSGQEWSQSHFRGADTTSSPEHPAPTIEIVRPLNVSEESSGIEWQDAAAGAGTAAGLMLLFGAGGAVLVRRRTRPQVQ